MAQASSAYSTSGNQYNATNSYFLIDSVPGSGDAIPGPVTISATLPAVALTVAGNEVVTGALGVTGNVTTAGNVLTNLIAPFSTLGPGTALTVSSPSTLDISGGLTRVFSNNGNLVLKAVNPVTNAFLLGGQAFVQNLAGGGMSVNQGETLFGYNASFNEKVRMEHGLSLVPGMGTYAAPAAATPVGGGAFTFTMTGNKAFITAGPAAFNLTILLPLDGLGNTDNWTALITQVGATPTNVTTVTQTGISIICLNAGITTPITLAVTLL
jgi:hypothetical protein